MRVNVQMKKIAETKQCNVKGHHYHYVYGKFWFQATVRLEPQIVCNICSELLCGATAPYRNYKIQIKFAKLRNVT